MIISFVTYEHPTEGLLIRPTIFAGEDKAWTQGWQRCVGHLNGGKPITPAEAAGAGWDLTGITIRDDGAVSEAPTLRTGITGAYDEDHGLVADDGIKVEWGGACPIQGEGSVDGRTIYYRARGSGWRIDIAEGSQSEFTYGESEYIWPDGGWLNAAESERNIRLGVAKWRESMSASRGWKREMAPTLSDGVWLALDFVPPEDGADWEQAVALGLMECPEGPSYEHHLTDKGQALLAYRDEVARKLEFDRRG